MLIDPIESMIYFIEIMHKIAVISANHCVTNVP